MPPQTAKVTELAVREGRRDVDGSDIEQRILDRVKKCLERARHPNTPEGEAKAAWRMASRIMAQHNVTQADLLNDAQYGKDFAALGGRSVVAITRSKPDGRRVTFQTWVSEIAVAMTTLFDCKGYSTGRLDSVDWTFYGIAANTVSAAMAFENAHNLALAWAAGKKGRSAKHSYCLGIGKGLITIAKDEKEKEEQRIRDTEQNSKVPHQDTNIHPDVGEEADPVPILTNISARGASSVGPCVKEDDDGQENLTFLPEHIDSDEEETEVDVTFKEENDVPIDLNVDIEQQIRDSVPKHERKVPLDELNNIVGDQSEINPWNTSQALVKFRQSAQKVAEEYIKAQKTKLTKERSANVYNISDIKAFGEGFEDSKNINLKRKRIEDA